MEDMDFFELATRLLNEKKYVTLKKILEEEEPVDIASLLEELPHNQLLLAFRLLPKEPAAEVFAYLDPDQQEALIQSFSDNELREVLDELYIDDAVDMIEEMPANVVKRILRHTSAEMRADINNLLKYPKDSAGSLMTTEYVDLKKMLTVRDAIRHIRRTGIDKETIYTCYVTDENRLLIGYLSVKDLLLNESDTLIEDIMDTSVISVNTMTDKEEVANLLSRYDFIAMPVVDGDGRLVGIVTVDDAIDVITDEATEDIQKMAGIVPTDEDYMKSGVIDIWSKRIPWLLLLMLSATFTGIIISGFESALAACVTLTAFIPMLMDTGGNSGSQSAVTIIRSISLGDVQFSDILKIIWKEIRVAVLCGVTLAGANFVKMMLIDRLLMNNEEVTLLVALVVCLTLVIVIIFAKVIGCSLPLIFDKFGFDPAIMSSPFITTIVDAISLLIYFCIASSILPGI